MWWRVLPHARPIVLWGPTTREVACGGSADRSADLVLGVPRLALDDQRFLEAETLLELAFEVHEHPDRGRDRGLHDAQLRAWDMSLDTLDRDSPRRSVIASWVRSSS